MATVLVVDDEPPILELLSDFLTDAGYSVRTATGGRAALEAVEQDPPDLVLSDVFMPELDGWTLASELRRRFPSVEIVLMSAFRPSFPVGRLRFVSKPFNFDALLDQIAEAIG